METIGFIGGGLPEPYEFVGLHFHWGSGPYRGSEHVIDGKRYEQDSTNNEILPRLYLLFRRSMIARQIS